MELADAERLKELEKENLELRKMLAESMLENRMLQVVNNGTPFAQKVSCCAYCTTAAVLGAKGIH